MDLTLRDLVKSFPQDSSFQRVLAAKIDLYASKQILSEKDRTYLLACLLSCSALMQPRTRLRKFGSVISPITAYRLLPFDTITSCRSHAERLVFPPAYLLVCLVLLDICCTSFSRKFSELNLPTGIGPCLSSSFFKTMLVKKSSLFLLFSSLFAPNGVCASLFARRSVSSAMSCSDYSRPNGPRLPFHFEKK